MKSQIALTIFSLIALSLTAMAQEQANHWQKFVVLLKDSTRIEGTSGVLSDSTFEGLDSKQAQIKIPVEKIKTLFVCNGSKGTEMTWLGGCAGFVLGIGAVAKVAQTNSSSINAVEATVAVAGTTALGALLFGWAGSEVSDWKVVPIPRAMSAPDTARSVSDSSTNQK